MKFRTYVLKIQKYNGCCACGRARKTCTLHNPADWVPRRKQRKRRYYILAVQYPRRESRENDSQLPNHSAQTPGQHKCHKRSLGNEPPTGRPQNRTGNLRKTLGQTHNFDGMVSAICWRMVLVRDTQYTQNLHLPPAYEFLAAVKA